MRRPAAEQKAEKRESALPEWLHLTIVVAFVFGAILMLMLKIVFF
jgi:hypothetical protein